LHKILQTLNAGILSRDAIKSKCMKHLIFRIATRHNTSTAERSAPDSSTAIINSLFVQYFITFRPSNSMRLKFNESQYLKSSPNGTKFNYTNFIKTTITITQKPYL